MNRIIFSLLIITGLLAMPFHAAALDVKDKELLLYFSFDKEEEGVVYDLSRHGNDGNITGTVEWVDGKYGKALKFNQSGEVRAPYIPLNNKSFTVTIWINPMLDPGNQCVFTQKKENAKNTSLHYRIYPNGKARMGFYAGLFSFRFFGQILSQLLIFMKSRYSVIFRATSAILHLKTIYFLR